MINIGKYIEMLINWLTEHFAPFFDAMDSAIGGFINGFQHLLYLIPFYITIPLLAALAWWKAGRGTAIFTLLGLGLIYGMGFWAETMQTLALVLSSTSLALLLGIPLGIWSARSPRCNQVLRPILDLMQTMPAFVYLIPAVLFFGLGTVPGAFATIGDSASAARSDRGFTLVRSDFVATPLQGATASGVTNHSHRYKPDDYDVAVNGRDRRHDLGRRSGRGGAQGNYPDEDRAGI